MFSKIINIYNKELARPLGVVWCSIRMPGHQNVCKEAQRSTHYIVGQRGQISWNSTICIPDCLATKPEGDEGSYSGDYRSGRLHQDWQEARKTQEDWRYSWNQLHNKLVLLTRASECEHIVNDMSYRSSHMIGWRERLTQATPSDRDT
jgi:hypothetical protein